MAKAPWGLLERADELDALDQLIADAVARRGGSVVLAGVAGIGKTTLAREAVRRGRQAGLRVLAVRPEEVDRGVPFGVVRDLLTPSLVDPGTLGGPTTGRALDVLRGVPRADESQRSQELDPGVLHGLYWLVASIADRSPLLAVVDDAQWADAASLRFLGYLVRRLEGLPVGLLLTARPGSGEVALSEVTGGVSDSVLEPAPLSIAAVAELTRGRLGSDLPESLPAVVHAATSGNPLAVHDVLKALLDANVDPSQVTTRLAGDPGRRATADRVKASLDCLDPQASLLAAALAVVGALDGFESVGAVAGLTHAVSAKAARTLADADLLLSTGHPEFVHPLVRDAVRATIDVVLRDEFSRRAARLLLARGDHLAAAGHLVTVRPGGDPWVVEVLMRAVSAAAGAPDVTVDLARRALAEPPPAERIAEIHGTLGRLEIALGDPGSVGHLGRAVRDAPDSRSRARDAESLSLALIHQVRLRDAASVLSEAAEAVRGDDAALADELELRMLLFALWDPQQRPAVTERLQREAGVTRRQGRYAQRLSHLVQAVEAVASCRPVEEASALLERALAEDTLLERSPTIALVAAPLLTSCGHPSRARRLVEPVIALTRAAGALPELRAAIGLRGQVAMAEGDVLAAETDGWAMQELLREGALGPPYLLAFFIEALLARGEVDEAAQMLVQAGLTGPLPDIAPANVILCARAMVRVAQGEPHAAHDDLVECGRRQGRLGQHNPALVPWRGALAEVLTALGRHEEARDTSDQNVLLARRFGADHVIGAALRVRAVVGGEVSDLHLLDEALRRLEHSSARLELARVHQARGAALAAAGARSQARESFGLAASLAHDLGASAVAEASTQGLLAAGGRPRRPLARGAAALTPAERRVSELTASGATNREIAQTLFVTEKTVETHLRQVFRKLDVGSRAQVGHALGTPRPPR